MHINECWAKTTIRRSTVKACQDWYMLKEGRLHDTAPEGFNTELKVGDLVQWTNAYGVVWRHKILGFGLNDLCQYTPDRFVYLDSDAFWSPHSLASLTKI